MVELEQRIAALLDQALDHRQGAGIEALTAERGLAAEGLYTLATVLTLEEVARLAVTVIKDNL
jgi:hypothetical protein